MRTPERVRERRVQVVIRVRVKMMAAMMGRPPERPLLVRSCAKKGNQELENPAAAVRAVREETMKPGGDRKHPYDVQSQTGHDRRNAHARPDDKQASHMHEEELNTDGIIQLLRVEPEKALA